jgi:hypothetical protein
MATMQVAHMIEQLQLSVIADADLTRQISGGYASDLLSCVMAGAAAGNVWVTLQCHPNVIAVASLLDLAAVVITEGMAADEETVRRAREEEINLLASAQNTFTVVGQLVMAGIRGNRTS